MKDSSLLPKNDTLSDPKIASNFTTFGSLSGAVFDSENVLDPQNVSVMSSKFLYGIIALQQTHSESLKRFHSSYIVCLLYTSPSPRDS